MVPGVAAGFETWMEVAELNSALSNSHDATSRTSLGDVGVGSRAAVDARG